MLRGERHLHKGTSLCRQQQSKRYCDLIKEVCPLNQFVFPDNAFGSRVIRQTVLDADKISVMQKVQIMTDIDFARSERVSGCMITGAVMMEKVRFSSFGFNISS